MHATAHRPVRGRESLLAKKAVLLGMEVLALRQERAQIGALAPYALRVHNYVATRGDSLEAEQLAAFVAAKLEAAARRR